MTDRLEEGAGGIMALLERVAGLMDGVSATQGRMEERQLELEATVRGIAGDVTKLSAEHGDTAAAVARLLEKTRKVSCHLKDVRVRVESQNLRVKKVEASQAELLAKNKFRVVIYQGDQEVKSVPAGQEPPPEGSGAPGGGAGGGAAAEIEADHFDLPPESDEEYMVVEESAAVAARAKKSGLTRIESFKATFTKENMTKTRADLGSKVNKLGERIVSTERRERIRQSGERLKQSGAHLRESIAAVPAKLNLRKERTVAEGQEVADGVEAGAKEEGGAGPAPAPVPPPKGARRGTPEEMMAAAPAAPGNNEGDAASEVPMYDMKQLS